jgi:hypothetical protein
MFFIFVLSERWRNIIHKLEEDAKCVRERKGNARVGHWWKMGIVVWEEDEVERLDLRTWS